jgi:hypothetical protein
MAFTAPVHDRPGLSLIISGLKPNGAKLYVGGTDAAGDVALLREHGITTVVNCAVNLDINYVEPDPSTPRGRATVGHAPVRYYKIGLVDDFGNPETMMLGAYFILHGAMHQKLPERASYPNRDFGNVLVHCRGGRSRSVALVTLYLHLDMPERFPTMEAALAHVRTHRLLMEDEWHETPKPTLFNAACEAARLVRLVEKARSV